MTTPARCTQPGCDGTIDAGYCDVCGVAAAPVAASVAAPASAARVGVCFGADRGAQRAGDGGHRGVLGKQALAFRRHQGVPAIALVPWQPWRGPDRGPASSRAGPGDGGARQPAGP